MKDITKYIIIGILLAHIAALAFSSYSLFSDFHSFTIYHVTPIGLAIFTAAWFGIVMKKRWCAFAYFFLTFFDMAVKLFFGNYDYGKALTILFPINLIFSFAILFLYKHHFGDRKDK